MDRTTHPAAESHLRMGETRSRDRLKTSSRQAWAVSNKSARGGIAVRNNFIAASLTIFAIVLTAVTLVPSDVLGQARGAGAAPPPARQAGGRQARPDRFLSGP